MNWERSSAFAHARISTQDMLLELRAVTNKLRGAGCMDELMEADAKAVEKALSHLSRGVADYFIKERGW